MGHENKNKFGSLETLLCPYNNTSFIGIIVIGRGLKLASVSGPQSRKFSEEG